MVEEEIAGQRLKTSFRYAEDTGENLASRAMVLQWTAGALAQVSVRLVSPTSQSTTAASAASWLAPALRSR